MKFEIQPNEVPAIRIADAVGRGTNKNILFTVGGGLGDRICAEPTIRFAMESYVDCQFSVHSATPEIFKHLSFRHVYRDGEPPAAGKFLQLVTYGWGLANQFFNPNLMHAIDYASIAALRAQLPEKYRVPKLIAVSPSNTELHKLAGNPQFVLLHVGDSWPSRTFPEKFWNSMAYEIVKIGRTPVYIGQTKNLFEVIPGNKAVDLRNKLLLEEYLWLVQKCDTAVTNDSSPIHIAATGTGKIAFIPTCRRPEFLTHHRHANGKIVHGWKMQAFYKAPMWEHFHHIPNTLDEWPANKVPDGHQMEDFLPEPSAIADWIKRTA